MQNIKEIPFYAVGLSLFSTLLSPISLLLLVENGQKGLAYLVWAQLGAFLASIVVARSLRFFGKEISVYEYLSNRFGISQLKLLLSGLFAFYQVIRVSLISFLVAQAVYSLFSIPLWLTSLLLIGCTIWYSERGGLNGIVWIDALQALIMLVWLIIVSGFWTGVATNTWLGLRLDLNPILSVIVFIGGFCNTLSTYMSSQDLYQRIRSEDAVKVRAGIYTQACTSLFSAVALYAIGFLLQGTGRSGNVVELLAGTTIVSKITFVIVLISAAQSTISSSLNAVAESIRNDFNASWSIRRLTVIVGAICLLAAVILSSITVSNWYNWFNGVIGYVFGTVAGVVVLAVVKPTKKALLRYAIGAFLLFIISLFEFWNSWLNSVTLLMLAFMIGGKIEDYWNYINEKWLKRGC